jgi:hypothetical protein
LLNFSTGRNLSLSENSQTVFKFLLPPGPVEHGGRTGRKTDR